MQGKREVPQFKIGDKVRVDFKFLTTKREDAPKTKRIAKVWDARYYPAINAITYVIKLRNGEKFEVLAKGVRAVKEKKRGKNENKKTF